MLGMPSLVGLVLVQGAVASRFSIAIERREGKYFTAFRERGKLNFLGYCVYTNRSKMFRKRINKLNIYICAFFGFLELLIAPRVPQFHVARYIITPFLIIIK